MYIVLVSNLSNESIELALIYSALSLCLHILDIDLLNERNDEAESEEM